MGRIRSKSQKAQTLEVLADGFWDWEAPYARCGRARGKSISHGTLDIAEANTKNHILPRWGQTNVADLTAAEIDTWILTIQEEKELAPETGNKIL
jgi:hypothetical protein